MIICRRSFFFYKTPFLPFDICESAFDILHIHSEVSLNGWTTYVPHLHTNNSNPYQTIELQTDRRLRCREYKKFIFVVLIWKGDFIAKQKGANALPANQYGRRYHYNATREIFMPASTHTFLCGQSIHVWTAHTLYTLIQGQLVFKLREQQSLTRQLLHLDYKESLQFEKHCPGCIKYRK